MPVITGNTVGGKYYVTSVVGDPRPYRNGIHEGIDFGVPIGTPLVAIGGGTITYSESRYGGFTAKLTLDDGRVARYLHLSKDEDYLKRMPKAGSRVEAGDLIAFSGDTGVGPAHFHFEMHDPDGNVINLNNMAFYNQVKTGPALTQPPMTYYSAIVESGGIRAITTDDRDSAIYGKLKAHWTGLAGYLEKQLPGINLRTDDGTVVDFETGLSRLHKQFEIPRNPGEIVGRTTAAMLLTLVEQSGHSTIKAPAVVPPELVARIAAKLDVAQRPVETVGEDSPGPTVAAVNLNLPENVTSALQKFVDIPQVIPWGASKSEHLPIVRQALLQYMERYHPESTLLTRYRERVELLNETNSPFFGLADCDVIKLLRETEAAKGFTIGRGLDFTGTDARALLNL